MLIYLFRRLLWAPVVLFTVTFSTFVLGNYGPGDPVQVLMGQHNNPEVVERIRKEKGLDRPFYIQYADYVRGVLRGDLGESFKYSGEPVRDLLLRKIGVSVQLGLVAMFISLAVGLSFGLMTALNQGKWIDPAAVSTALFLSSVPVFILVPILVLVFSRWLHLLPSYGWGGVLDAKIIMPAMVLSLGPVGGLTRLMRASTLEVIGQDYVRTAYSKGLAEGKILRDHIARNAILPIFTVVGMSLATLVEGAFITETLFGIPGVGRLAVESFFARDYPVIMAFGLIVAISYFVANLLVDIGYAFIDPRIRYQ